jgi:RNA polymerase sigma-70 factor (ECF subfamily)
VAGDQHALAWLVETYTPVAFGQAMSIMRNEQDAKDIAHDSMLKVLKNLDRYSSEWRFTTWVMRIARNTAIDVIRKRRRQSWAPVPDMADCALLQDEAMVHKQEAATVRQALSDLPPRYREVLELHHFRHLKYREIATHLDVPLGTVMNRIFRARQKLKNS